MVFLVNVFLSVPSAFGEETSFSEDEPGFPYSNRKTISRIYFSLNLVLKWIKNESYYLQRVE